MADPLPSRKHFTYLPDKRYFVPLCDTGTTLSLLFCTHLLEFYWSFVAIRTSLCTARLGIQIRVLQAEQRWETPLQHE